MLTIVLHEPYASFLQFLANHYGTSIDDAFIRCLKQQLEIIEFDLANLTDSDIAITVDDNNNNDGDGNGDDNIADIMIGNDE